MIEIRAAYERGRWRDAGRDAIPLVVALALVLSAGEARPARALLAVAVGIGFVALRWRGLGWGRGAAVGAVAGLAPLLAPVLLLANGLGCVGPDCATGCLAVCASGGLVAGAVVGSRATSGRALVGGGLVAALVGLVGCWPMGVTTMAGMAGALLVGEVAAGLGRWATARARRA